MSEGLEAVLIVTCGAFCLACVGVFRLCRNLVFGGIRLPKIVIESKVTSDLRVKQQEEREP